MRVNSRNAYPNRYDWSRVNVPPLRVNVITFPRRRQSMRLRDRIAVSVASGVIGFIMVALWWGLAHPV